MSPQPASLLPALAHPMVVTLFIDTDAGDQLADAQDGSATRGRPGAADQPAF
jgi:hypothetical protein